MALKNIGANMSSDDFEKSGWSPRSPAERVLMVLKMHGGQSSAGIGAKLGITSEAARQQLGRLLDEGLVREERRAEGRGRPASVWSLSDQAQARFPDTHAALTVELLGNVSRILGTDALDRIIEAREADTEARYRMAMEDCTTLQSRVVALAALRRDEGYMATVEETGDGHFRLIENHCPICAAATLCQGFCRAEKAVFESLLGDDVRVEREEHIVQGGRRCSYLISGQA